MRALPVLMLFFASVTAGVSAPPPASASRVSDLPPVQRAGSSTNPLLTQDQVDSWIVKWQKRLALEDWQIESKIVRVYELPENAVANIHWSLPKKTATIRVLNSVDSSLRKSEILKDTELSVVHELVHLSMSKLPLDPKHTELEEEAVKKLSIALLALEDGKK